MTIFDKLNSDRNREVIRELQISKTEISGVFWITFLRKQLFSATKTDSLLKRTLPIFRIFVIFAEKCQDSHLLATKFWLGSDTFCR